MKKAKTTNAEPLVLAEEIPTSVDGCRIGIMTLNSPRTMNAVDLEMVNLIDDIIAGWQKDDSIVAMVMRGAGDDAFCAGGDIRKLYDSMTATGKKHLKYADDFFHGEYSKNYRVHLFGKPLIAWGNGFVMGGGLGLYIGASHRVGTEKLRLAWPEIRIGLFPDVAGTYYLSRLPFPYGHWMAFSGSEMNARDCHSVGLINYCLPHDGYEEMLVSLAALPWQKNKAINNQHVRELLSGMHETGVDQMPEAELEKATPLLKELFTDLIPPGSSASLENNNRRLTELERRMRAVRSRNKWIKQGVNNFLKGCPGTAHLIMEQLLNGPSMTLKEVAMYELTLALRSVRAPDFREGIRAMIVDKDNKPAWQHKSVSDVPTAWTESFFRSFWEEDKHPFQEL